MKQRIYRYIAIALGILSLFVAYVEINVSGIPFFGFMCALAAKQFYDDSEGRVYDGVPRHRLGTQDTSRVSYSMPNHFDSITSEPISHSSAASSFAHGENTFDRGSINNFD